MEETAWSAWVEDKATVAAQGSATASEHERDLKMRRARHSGEIERQVRRSESRVRVLPFMKVRSIHDNFQSMQLTCNRSCLLLKIDIAKDFDSVCLSRLKSYGSSDKSSR
jgi:hypothetical protein